MFKTKRLELEIKTLQAMYCELEGKYNKLQETINSQEWLDLWHQYLANKDTAGASMQFQLISKADVLLLEKVIQECNKNEDLAAMLRTSDGQVLTLRTYPVEINNKIKSAMAKFNKGE